MPALATAALIAGGLGLGKTIFGGARFLQGQREYKNLINNLPKYEIPSEYEANVNLAKSEAQSGMPGVDVAKNMIYSSTSAGLSRAEEAAASSIDLLGATTDMYAKELEALNNLAFQDAQFRVQGVEKLMNANLALAGQKEKQWETNTWIPSQMKLNVAQSKMGFGQSMLQSGINDVAGSITSYVTESAIIEELRKIFGKETIDLGTAGTSGGGISLDKVLSGMSGFKPQANKYGRMWDIMSPYALNKAKLKVGG